MQDYDLNPHVQNLGRPYENRVYDSTYSHKCRWCGCEGDIIHEEMCKMNPDVKMAPFKNLPLDNDPVCGFCAGMLIPTGTEYKCFHCGTMHYLETANNAFVNGRLLVFDAVIVTPYN